MLEYSVTRASVPWPPVRTIVESETWMGQGSSLSFYSLCSFSSSHLLISSSSCERDLNRAMVFPSRPVKLKASYSCPSYWTNMLSVSLAREVFSSFDNHSSGLFCNLNTKTNYPLLHLKCNWILCKMTRYCMRAGTGGGKYLEEE